MWLLFTVFGSGLKRDSCGCTSELPNPVMSLRAVLSTLLNIQGLPSKADMNDTSRMLVRTPGLNYFIRGLEWLITEGANVWRCLKGTSAVGASWRLVPRNIIMPKLQMSLDKLKVNTPVVSLALNTILIGWLVITWPCINLKVPWLGYIFKKCIPIGIHLRLVAWCFEAHFLAIPGNLSLVLRKFLKHSGTVLG